MTVTYSLDVSTSSLTTFLKVLFRWRGSVYKALYKELVIFLAMFYAVNVTYRFALNDAQKRQFEIAARYCRHYSDSIPVSFLLGFFISTIFGRWWKQFQTIAWPDTVGLLISTFLHGNDERGRLLRRAAIRYCNLAFVLGCRLASSAVKKRFPTFQHVVEAGFMTQRELYALENVPTKYPKQWVPIQWAMNIMALARQEQRINNDIALVEIVKRMNELRLNVRDMNFFDWICVPLVYTQVITLAVYSYFLPRLLGRQYLESDVDEKGMPGENAIDLYFPVFTFLQFLFYVGWLKVAEVMINPFGEDDDDFEVNFIIDRNIQISYVFVDAMYSSIPHPLEKDIFWEEDMDSVFIPHTAASQDVKASAPGFGGSTREIKLNRDQTEVVIPEMIPEIALEDESLHDQLTLMRKLTTFMTSGDGSSSSLVGRVLRKISASQFSEKSKTSNTFDRQLSSQDGSIANSVHRSSGRRSGKIQTRPLRSVSSRPDIAVLNAAMMDATGDDDAAFTRCESPFSSTRSMPSKHSEARSAAMQNKMVDKKSSFPLTKEDEKMRADQLKHPTSTTDPQLLDVQHLETISEDSRSFLEESTAVMPNGVPIGNAGAEGESASTHIKWKDFYWQKITDAVRRSSTDEAASEEPLPEPLSRTLSNEIGVVRKGSKKSFTSSTATLTAAEQQPQ